jgi:hypothetical protein
MKIAPHEALDSMLATPAPRRLRSPGGCIATSFAPECQVSKVLVDFYRCPDDLGPLSSGEPYSSQPTYSDFSPSLSDREPASISQADLDSHGLSAISEEFAFDESALRLPFEASRIIDNFRLERYAKSVDVGADGPLSSEAARRFYYLLRPLLGSSLRKQLQRWFLRDWPRLPFPRWPVDTSVEEIFARHLLLTMKDAGVERAPFIWFWPDGAPSAAVMTHDVEAPAGLAFIPNLIDVDDEFGIKTSFQLVPERRYAVSSQLLGLIRERQCEVNVHGLNHDGNLFRDQKTFKEQSKWINHYVQKFQAEGFRSSCMYRNVDWYEDLNVSYDMSVPNVAHLEPQRGGCCTVFPYFIGKILELPLTTVQDYSLFHILGDYSIELWKKQIECIMQKNGLISFIAHPDYLLDKRSLDVYRTLLNYLSNLRRNKNVWISRPGDINRWWRQRSAMKLVLEDGKWRVQGPGSERARVGFAHLRNDKIALTVEKNSEAASGLRS